MKKEIVTIKYPLRYLEQIILIVLIVYFGINFKMTFSNCKTEDGKLTIYTSEGEFTDDDIEKEFFGCGGVAHIDHLQNKLITLARNGFKHHTTVGVGHLKHILDEAFKTYLHYDLVDIDK